MINVDWDGQGDQLDVEYQLRYLTTGKEVEKYGQRETGDLGNKILKQHYKRLVCLFKLFLVIVCITFLLVGCVSSFI